MMNPELAELPQSDMGPTSGHGKDRAPVEAKPEADERDGDLDSGSLVQNQPNTKPAADAPAAR